MIFSASEFASYFRFAFVRNPWDRLYSAYRFLSTGGREEIDRRWCREHLADIPDFETFVLTGLRRPDIPRAIHLRPQHVFLRNAITNKISGFQLGRYKQLEEDFSYVAKRLGVNKPLPHLNPSRIQGDYREAYSTRMRAVAEDLYARDIGTFGYKF